ncbi:von Willebrand factor A domain-containing protein 8 [Macrosteles quadrilineatus]|uniref:von Willebrand factor A domain-containing protein 8 n=1 Tax=Macrosteles quadrilineatus TaxID=74068 RepID=UPI0023E24E56|nr:von Willebrand factor A domain-containing protein 8 [Macrosteles quadrilineatus]
MISRNIATRRLSVLNKILSTSVRHTCAGDLKRQYSTSTKGEKIVSIGDVSKTVNPAKHAEYVPRKYLLEPLSQDNLHTLRWMMQKDILGQDMFLLGGPGPRRARLALAYLELTERELEYVALSRDTTESDLKQRREIHSATATYFDQSAVRAAVEGRVLVLQGIEKAERNVLPVLNNLLENREMHLEDGRFLIPASRYDQLLKEHGEEEMKKWGLVRVSEDFRVIALGLPVPGYTGNPLDPPLRSRFQARNISTPSYQSLLEWLSAVHPSAPQSQLAQLVSAASTLLSPESGTLGLPDFPTDNLDKAAHLMAVFPWISVRDVFSRLYPYQSLLGAEGCRAVEDILSSFRVPQVGAEYEVTRVDVGEGQHTTTAVVHAGFSKAEVQVRCGSVSPDRPPLTDYVDTESQRRSLGQLFQSHVAGDVCVVGPRGCGKSAVVNMLSHMLGYTVEPIVLYQDMTSRDLIQQRGTLPNGDTVWRNAPLVAAALEGRLAVLDGLHRLHPSTLAVLQRLVQDRELQLYDGTRLVSHERYDQLAGELGEEGLQAARVLRVHPSFRVVALAEPPGGGASQWLNPEVLSLFLYHQMPALSQEQELHIMQKKFGRAAPAVLEVVKLSHMLRNSSDPTLQSLASSLSTRQLLRVARRAAAYPALGPYEIVQQACLGKFLPPLARQALEAVLKRSGIRPEQKSHSATTTIQLTDDSVTVGDTTAARAPTTAASKVPDILFYDIPQHVVLLERLLQDYLLGEHLLLVGNQGVGKNKIADKLLQLLNRPREYIQLHRDTTVQSLTLRASVRDGVVVYEDSPLVQAAHTGHVLVVDEADKAPTHVTCILKTLVESGEMILSDGRRIVPADDPRAVNQSPGIIPLHPDFRMIVLANRPGFPFLGNDFFGALGDLFSCHAVDNPSAQSEEALLAHYGPDVPSETVSRLVAAFSQLRDLADQGLVSYPYSTREAVNIVKHLQAYPKDSLEDIVSNVFDFDVYSQDLRDTILQVLARHGINVQLSLAEQKHREYLQLTVQRESGEDVSSPKHGKVDEKGDPHVGGNTWAGGTGGRDTAGLGGKGGPYRLDAGHTVYQVSDEEKAAVPEHVRKAAREMAQKAFKEKLREIKMSEYDASLYEQFFMAVSKQVQALRVIVNSLQARSRDRLWLRNQTTGELDDAKLIEGITGEKNIYKRRGEKEPEVGTPQTKPKRLKLVVDVSGSMYRFNGFDGRLEREMEAVVLVMEAFQGYEARLQYDIVGHSGEADCIPLVAPGRPPANNKERLEVIRTMHAHAQFCMAGDHTLEATAHAVKSLAEEDCDEAIVIVLSDANLSRYAIPANKLTSALTLDPRVDAYVIFIGSLGDQATRLVEALPAGRGFICMELHLLPQILHQIFASSILKTR